MKKETEVWWEDSEASDLLYQNAGVPLICSGDMNTWCCNFEINENESISPILIWQSLKTKELEIAVNKAIIRSMFFFFLKDFFF